MLVLTRRIGERIIVGQNINITVVSMKGGRVRIGIEAPPSVTVDRQEVHDRLTAWRQATVDSAVADDAVQAIGTS